jgi:hypothetical protein
MSAPNSLTVFVKGETVKCLHQYSGVEKMVVNQVLYNKDNIRHYTFRKADGSITEPIHNDHKLYVSDFVSDEVYLLYRFTKLPPCEFGDGCCKGSGCCFRSGELFSLVASNKLTASYKASYWASLNASILASNDTFSRDMYFSD